MLKLAWLGSPIAEIDGAQLHFETRKVAALLAYLSLNPNPIPREKLAALFWPEANQSHALANLRRALSSLIHSLPTGHILAEREAIEWIVNQPVQIDVAEFQSCLANVRKHQHDQITTCTTCMNILETIVEIPRGDFLEGMNLPDCPEFDDWQYLVREEVKSDLAWILEQLTIGWSNCAVWDKAIRAARRWVALDKLVLNAQLALVDTYVRSGQRLLAQRQFEEYAQLNRIELGQELDRETLDIFQSHLNPPQPVSVKTKPAAATAAQSSLKILKSKLYLPGLKTNRITRKRLLSKLDEISSNKLTLVSAPAGFGKTSLLANWVVFSKKPACWLSLDKGDNDPVSFFAYLCAAIDSLFEGICANTMAMLEALPPSEPLSYMMILLNDLERITEPFVLVLDDYQFITNRSIHEACTYLVERATESLHLVIASRADPPLQLSRLRAREELLEVRADDLRFTVAETETYFHEVMQLDIPAKEIQTLAERTEGWAVGLQMAALSLRDRKDVSSFIRNFSGTNRYILDYLLEEVLAGQSPEIQRFLLFTSTLERLTAPLCDALMSASWPLTAEIEPSSPNQNLVSTGRSAAYLEYLEKANLFLVPLDDERIWFRYHHLFADLLGVRFNQLYPALFPKLHLNAAVWLEQNGFTIDSLNHYLAAGEYIHAARVVEENTTRLLAQGEVNALMSWIEVLPAELRLTRPRLTLHQAYVLVMGGRLGEVPPLLAQVEAILDTLASPSAYVPALDNTVINHALSNESESISPEERRSISGSIAAIRAICMSLLGKTAQAISLAKQAGELLPPENLWDRAVAGWALGFALHMQGNLTEARTAFEEQVRLGRKMSSVATVMLALPDLSWLLRDMGQINQARIVLEEALAEASQKGARTLGFVARNKATLTAFLYEQNELEGATTMLQEALDLARYWPNPSHLPFTYVFLARTLLAKGDIAGARRAIGEAERLRSDPGLTRMIRRMVEVNLVRVWLAIQVSGFPIEASDPLESQINSIVSDWRCELAKIAESKAELFDDATEDAMLALARLKIHEGRDCEAESLVELLIERTRSAGHVNQLISALVLSAPLRRSRTIGRRKPVGRSDGVDGSCGAFTRLEQALEIAKSGGYVRIFLDEGKPMKMLLMEWLAQAGDGYLRDYASWLLSQFNAEGAQVARKLDGRSLALDLVEPLTPREVEVLGLICSGESNQGIADKLFITIKTVKKHSGNIFGKLGVTSRAQAMVKAIQLGLLPKDS